VCGAAGQIFDVLFELATDAAPQRGRTSRTLRNKDALVLIVDLLTIAPDVAQKHVLRTLLGLLHTADGVARWREGCGLSTVFELLHYLPEHLR